MMFKPSIICRIAAASRLDANGCIIWIAGRNTNGYGILNVREGSNAKQYKAHRLAWEVVNGPIPDGLFVCHKCDVRACVNTEHLFLGTQADNLADMAAKGRSTFGSRNARSKLTDAQIVEIRGTLASQREMGRRFGVTQTTVGRIRNQKGWTHVAKGPSGRIDMRDGNPGAKNGQCKLTVEQVLAIRAAEDSQARIASKFGVSQVTVCRIKHRTRWAHIPEAGVSSR